MPTALAEPEQSTINAAEPTELTLDPIGPLREIVAARARLNGNLADSGGPPYDWMEPGAGTHAEVETRVELRVEGTYGGVTLPAPAEVFYLPEGDLLRCVYYTLTVAIGVTQPEAIIRWWLEPGGDDATLRTDALDFLNALHRPGLLTATDLNLRREVGRSRLRGAEGFDEELALAHEFLQRVAVLEEWSGTKVPVPEEVGEDEATTVARSAAIVLARQVPLSVSEELDVTLSEPTTDFDELRLPRDLSAEVLGVEVPLGRVTATVPVDVTGTERLDDGRTRVRCVVRDGQSRHMQLHLQPPPTRARLLRRTLVAGSPVPPRPEHVGQKSTFRMLDEVDRYLSEREQESGLLPDDVIAAVEAEWPE